jgi:hypothetical protein
MVCAERAIGLEIILGTPMELLGDVGHVEARFSSFGDSVNLGQDRCKICAEYTMGIEIILGTPDVIPS